MSGFIGSPFARRHLSALGRLPAGTMNKTEQAFAQHLDLLKHAGEIQWWKFEGIKLRLADNTFLTVDFAVLPASGYLEMIDVKGAKGVVTEDFKVKIKTAADIYPLVFKVAYPIPKKAGGGWDIETISRVSDGSIS